MKKRRLLISTVLITVLLGITMLTGCLDDYEDYEDYSDAEYSGDSDSADTSSFGSDVNLSDEASFPNGTCNELDGNIVVVSIFANDNTSSWDFENPADVEMYDNMATRMRIGLDWLEQQAVNYGRDVKFISNFNEDEELFYVADFDCDFSDNAYHFDAVMPFMDENMNALGAHLMEKYDADNIFFALFLNKPEDTTMSSYAYPFYGSDMGFLYPYECAIYSSYVYGAQQGPAMYAHEVLHLFGAPDLYRADTDGTNCGITQEFSDYCRENHLNEIMFSNYDVTDNSVNFEAVTNELTNLTAYFIGWSDSDEECETFGISR